MTAKTGLMLGQNPFLYYLSLMKSQDNRTVIVGLQELFMCLQSGYLLMRSERKMLEPQLIAIISHNDDSRVRRWAYMVGSFCINRELATVSMNRIEFEKDPENRTWIIALLAFNYEEDDFNKLLLKLNHGLSEDNIRLAVHLFSNNSKYRLNARDIEKIVEKNDKTSLFWVGSIAAYSALTKRRGKEFIISDEVVSSLTNHDDDEVLKHIMYAYTFRPKFMVKDELKFNYYDYLHMEPHHKKWYLTAIWKDPIFIRDNIEYVQSILDPRHLFVYCDKRIREGLARGLSEYKFEKLLVNGILEWLSYETEISVLHFLLQYILKWQDSCEEFKEVIADEITQNAEMIKAIIRTFGDKERIAEIDAQDYLQEQIKSGKIAIHNNGKIMSHKQDAIYLMGNIYSPSFIGGSNMSDSYTNYNSVIGNQGQNAGEKSTIVQTQGAQNWDVDFERMMQEFKKIKDFLYDEPHTDENEILIGEVAKLQKAVSEKDASQIQLILKEFGAQIIDIAKRVGCSICASYLVKLIGT